MVEEEKAKEGAQNKLAEPATSVFVPPGTEYPVEEKFLTAARKGDFDTVKECFSRSGKTILNCQDDDSYYSDVQKEWRAKSGKVNNSDLDRKHISNSALHFAAFGYDEDAGNVLASKMIEFVWSGDGDLNLKNTFGSTPLHVAAANGNAEAMNVLLDKGAEVSATNSIGNTPLHCAAYACQIECLNILLHHYKTHGEDVAKRVKETNGVSQSPIDYAKLSGNQDLENLLMEQGGEKRSEGVGLSDNDRADEKTAPAGEGQPQGDAQPTAPTEI